VRTRSCSQPKSIILFLLLVFALNSSIAQAKEVPPPARNNSQNKEQYLFVQTAHTGRIEKLPDNSGNYKITLHNVSLQVTCFSERPARKVYTIPTATFLAFWQNPEKDSFKFDPPNADLIAFTNVPSDTEEPMNVVVVLTEPIYNAETKTLSYLAKPVGENQAEIPTSADLHQIALFIDGVCLSCWYPH